MQPDKSLPGTGALVARAPETQSSQLPAGRSWGNDFHYRALFEQSDECIFIISFDLNYLAANPQALDLLGYPVGELIGMPVSQVVFLDESLDQDSADENATISERILRCKDGSLVPVEISTSLVYTEDGIPAYIQSIARDISKRKQAELALKRHNQILLSISDATTRLLQSTRIENKIADVLELLGRAVGALACFIIDLDPRASAQTSRVLAEWQKEDSPHLELAALFSPHVPAILARSSGIFAVDINTPPACSLAAVQIIGKPEALEYLGLLYPQPLDAWLLDQQDAVQIAANIIGAALQRNQREETIQLSEARHRGIIAALPDLIIRLDATGRVLDYNARTDHPLYRPQQQVVGKLLGEIWTPEIALAIMGDNNDGVFDTAHHVKGFKLPFSPLTYESRFVPIAAHEALLVIRDVSEQVRLDEMKSDFINRASHELRTPLTTVIMMANLIQEGGNPDELREYWGVLTSELNRQKNLIERLLIAGRLESGTMRLDLGPVDLISCLEESIMSVKPIAAKKRIAIQLNAPAPPLMVLGDKSGMQQVFINLINNAVKFSPAGSSVDLDIALTAATTSVSIRDHGMGIPAEDLPHLCERFFRGKNVTLAEIPGSGIGLYIVKSILEELEGSIDIKSSLGSGTTMIVSLKRLAES